MGKHEELAIRHNIESERSDSKFAKYFFRGLLAFGFTVSLGIIAEAANSDEFRVPGILAGSAVAVATVTIIPAEREATRSFDQADAQLTALDNRGEV